MNDQKKPTIGIFLAYAGQDRDAVHDLDRRLQAEGYRTWLKESHVMAGQQPRLETQKAMEDAAAVILCLS